MLVAESLAKARLSLAACGHRAFMRLMSGIETLLSLGNPNPELWANVRVTRTDSLWHKKAWKPNLLLEVEKINKAFETKVVYQQN